MDRRSKNLRHLYPCMGLQLGNSDFFRNHNSNGDSFILQSEQAKNMNAARPAKDVDPFCLRLFPCVWLVTPCRLHFFLLYIELCKISEIILFTKWSGLCVAWPTTKDSVYRCSPDKQERNKVCVRDYL